MGCRGLTLLIDGDILAYRAAASAEHEIRWDENLWTLHSDLRDAQRIFYEQMDAIDDALPNDRKIVALSPKQNFRYRIWPEYKANRKDKRRPMCLEALKEWISSEYEVFQRPDIEADDVLGILATSPYIVSGRKVIVSVDKDFRPTDGTCTKPSRETPPTVIRDVPKLAPRQQTRSLETR